MQISPQIIGQTPYRITFILLIISPNGKETKYQHSRRQ